MKKIKKLFYFLILFFLKHLKKPYINQKKIRFITIKSESGLGSFTEAIKEFFLKKYKIKNYEILHLEDLPKNHSINWNLSNKYINIFIGNPDILSHFSNLVDIKYILHSTNIALWFWELEKIPYKWYLYSLVIDHTWVCSNFTKKAFSPINKKFTLLPFDKLDIKIPKLKIAKKTNKFRFLFIFDFNSYYERKNPKDLIEAFKLTFSNNDMNVELVLKTRNHKNHMKKYNELIKSTKNYKNIKVITENLSHKMYFELIAKSNCYISLHRSEGFGLTLFEAIKMKVPVIATNYSGHLDFIKYKNYFPVNYKLVRIKKNEYPYYINQKWAQPNIEHASSLMKKIYLNKNSFK